MFEITKETKALVFILPFSEEVRSEDISRIEDNLTERIGVKCVILSHCFYEGGDFELKFHPQSAKQAEDCIDKPYEVLSQEPGDERNQGDDCLNNQYPVLTSRYRGLSFRQFAILCAALFFLGCLTEFLLNL